MGFHKVHLVAMDKQFTPILTFPHQGGRDNMIGNYARRVKSHFLDTNTHWVHNFWQVIDCVSLARDCTRHTEA